MKLTLGQAAKEAGISKPSLSAAIKNGRLSAYKNESGSYEIDPAELFRVYPPKTNANGLDNSRTLSHTNPSSNPHKAGKDANTNDVLDLLLAERDRLIAEKDKAIQRLEQEKAEIRADLEDQKAQSKRITLLLENRPSEMNDWQKALQGLEQRISNKETEAQREIEEMKKAAARQIAKYKKALEEEQAKPFWKKLFRSG
jgi:hypothetical protein